MARYRARLCPHCHYYVVVSISKPVVRPNEATVVGFCLNCGYKIPVRGLFYGIRRAAGAARRAPFRMANAAGLNFAAGGDEAQPPVSLSEKSMEPTLYARHLRAIGQDLENLGLTRFNLECAAQSYLVWACAGAVDTQPNSPLLANRRPQKLWQNLTQPRSRGREEVVTKSALGPRKGYRYAPEEIARMEQAGQARRKLASGVTDGHKLSQLLRTVGALLSQQNQKLLGISWQELSISVVFESDRGRRQIDVFRPDHLYDLWVQMYLRRNNRALSDLPR